MPSTGRSTRNPRDTGGIYGHIYNPISNSGDWDSQTSPITGKLALLNSFWEDQKPSPPINYSDVNGNDAINIVDLLLMMQYYAGLTPAVFIIQNADVNCNGMVNIIDSLLIAQYYVDIIWSFC